MGMKMTETNIGSRLSRIDAAFMAAQPQHVSDCCLQLVRVLVANTGQECAIIKAVDEVERENEWGPGTSKIPSQTRTIMQLATPCSRTTASTQRSLPGAVIRRTP
jgi:hypothetical protein